MAGSDEVRRGGIELVEPGDRGIVVEDDGPGSGLVAEDNDGGPDEGDDEGDDDARGFALEAARERTRAPAPVSRFGEPMPLSFADAQRIADGKLETLRILGLLERESLAQLGDEEVRAQLARFLKKLQRQEMQFGDLQKAPGKLPAYRAWLQELAALKDAPDAAQRLLAIASREERRAALEEVELHIKVALDDKVLEWTEHKKIMRKAEQLGLGDSDVEALYARFEPFEREPQAEAERAAASGWIAHPRLATKGEVFAWNLESLRDVLLERFDVAVELANQPHDKTYSLYDYLDRNRDDLHKEHALRAQAAAQEAGCPPLAVWYFLWATGPAVLHLAGRHQRPVRSRRRQLASIEELEELVANEWVIDDLGAALESGLLEHWLFIVTTNEPLFRRTAELRQQARGVPDSKRREFLRAASLRVLWAAGLQGLPLCDDAKRSVVAKDLAQLTSVAESCWDYLEWCLHSGVLAEWLDSFDHRQAARARECMTMAGPVVRDEVAAR